MSGRLPGKVAVVVGAGQTPGDTIGNGRATAHYRSTTPEDGRPKDDHHWWLLECRSDVSRIAVFTLSVLAEIAERQATSALADTSVSVCSANASSDTEISAG